MKLYLSMNTHIAKGHHGAPLFHRLCVSPLVHPPRDDDFDGISSFHQFPHFSFSTLPWWPRHQGVVVECKSSLAALQQILDSKAPIRAHRGAIGSRWNVVDLMAVACCGCAWSNWIDKYWYNDDGFFNHGHSSLFSRGMGTCLMWRPAHDQIPTRL